jgi:DNA-binding transcriptional regulator GbsR (MarR family)
MTRKLISLLQRRITEQNDSRLDLTKLSRQEVVQLSSILVRKVWERRRGVFRTGGRFARQLLQLTADKLERGERDTRRLPDRVEMEIEVDVATRDALEPRLTVSIERLEQARRRLQSFRPDPLVATRTFESSRLREARKRLEDLQRDDEPDAIPVSDDYLL